MLDEWRKSAEDLFYNNKGDIQKYAKTNESYYEMSS